MLVLTAILQCAASVSFYRCYSAQGILFTTRIKIEKELEDNTSQLNRLFFTTWSASPGFRFAHAGLKPCTTEPPALFRLGRRPEGLRFHHALSKFYGQAERAISIRKLQELPLFHSGPIKQVVFLCPSLPLRVGRSNLEEYFTLICIQRLLQPNFATQPCH